jgi:hypothetical protein
MGTIFRTSSPEIGFIAYNSSCANPRFDEALCAATQSNVRGIGRIIVADAYLDNLLSQTLYLFTGVGPKEGRLAIREPENDWN